MLPVWIANSPYRSCGSYGSYEPREWPTVELIEHRSDEHAELGLVESNTGAGPLPVGSHFNR